ncbi:hypothetical protein ACFSJ3_03205 [Corallincola platygyrae]|uniref:Uncharacterized protein n=1 Tax=Corallincola platygyrae TaxID=1193278 RepID=A0ABW4XJW0_9GAMM
MERAKSHPGDDRCALARVEFFKLEVVVDNKDKLDEIKKRSSELVDQAVTSVKQDVDTGDIATIAKNKFIIGGAVFLLLLLFMFTGSSELNCSDTDARNDVIDIVQYELEKAQWYQDMSTHISGIDIHTVKTIRIDEALKAKECKAKYQFDYDGETIDLDVRYDIEYVEDKDEYEVLAYADDLKSKVMAMAIMSQMR